jgi:leucyl-tRNA synthetase
MLKPFQSITGAYAEHPFTKEPIPVWIGDYVLGVTEQVLLWRFLVETKDYALISLKDKAECQSKYFDKDISEAAFGSKDSKLVDSDFLNG